MVSELKSWMRAMTQRGRLETEMEAELAEHVVQRTEDLMRAGMTRDDAARQEIGRAHV